jgi:hypothetical protein
MRTISARLLVLVAAFALVGAMSPAEAKHGWGNPGKHLGWYKHGWVHPGKHKGWYKHVGITRAGTWAGINITVGTDVLFP